MPPCKPAPNAGLDGCATEATGVRFKGDPVALPGNAICARESVELDGTAPFPHGSRDAAVGLGGGCTTDVRAFIDGSSRARGTPLSGSGEPPLVSPSPPKKPASLLSLAAPSSSAMASRLCGTSRCVCDKSGEDPPELLLVGVTHGVKIASALVCVSKSLAESWVRAEPAFCLELRLLLLPEAELCELLRDSLPRLEDWPSAWLSCGARRGATPLRTGMSVCHRGLQRSRRRTTKILQSAPTPGSHTRTWSSKVSLRKRRG